jgi:hypothetical protein
MSIGDAGQTTSILWRESVELLANAREARPLHHAEALLDLARVTAETHAKPLILRLAEAMADWDGRLLVAVGDDVLAPTLRAGDHLVVDWQMQPEEGDLVIAFVGGALIARAITWHERQQWLVANDGSAAIPLGPEVGILGVVVELRRALHRGAAGRKAA